MDIQYAGVTSCSDGIRRLIWIASYSSSDGFMTNGKMEKCTHSEIDV